MNYLKFWGTRGSSPVNGTQYAQFGGNTSCLEIVYDETTLVIDAGSGIRELGYKLAQHEEKPISLFISHPHWDHIMGFPFFKPFYAQDQPITIWSPLGSARPMKQLFEQLLAYEFCPIPFVQRNHHIDFKTLEPNQPLSFGPLTIDSYPTCHQGITFCFKITTPKQVIGYVTDNEMLQGYTGTLDHIPSTFFEPHLGLIDFLSDCDLLIHEAQFFPEEYETRIHWGHSSVINSIALIRATRIKQWFVVHHDPQHTDLDLKRLEELAQNLLTLYEIPCQVEWIPDGFKWAL